MAAHCQFADEFSLRHFRATTLTTSSRDSAKIKRLVRHATMTTTSAMLAWRNLTTRMHTAVYYVWEVWTSRLLITLVIVVVWDAYQKYSDTTSKQDDPPQQHHSSSKGSVTTTTARDDRVPNGTLPTTTEPVAAAASVVVGAAAATTTDVNGSLTKQEITTAPRNDDQEKAKHTTKSAARVATDVVASSSSSPTKKKEKKEAVDQQQLEQLEQEQELQRRRRLTAAGTLSSLAQFHYWYETEASLYRIYTLTRTDGVAVVPPYVPHSRRGTVPITLHVTNKTSEDITVSWVNYQGKYIVKGKIRKKGHVWTHTTWIDHRTLYIASVYLDVFQYMHIILSKPITFLSSNFLLLY